MAKDTPTRSMPGVAARPRAGAPRQRLAACATGDVLDVPGFSLWAIA